MALQVKSGNPEYRCCAQGADPAAEGEDHAGVVVVNGTHGRIPILQSELLSIPYLLKPGSVLFLNVLRSGREAVVRYSLTREPAWRIFS